MGLAPRHPPGETRGLSQREALVRQDLRKTGGEKRDGDSEKIKQRRGKQILHFVQDDIHMSVILSGSEESVLLSLFSNHFASLIPQSQVQYLRPSIVPARTRRKD